MLRYFYILCLCKITFVNSETTIWRLNEDQTKIVPGSDLNHSQSLINDDPVFNIILSTVHYGQSWVKHPSECPSCRKVEDDLLRNEKSDLNVFKCTTPVESTFYDNLVGVVYRNVHPNITEPHPDLVLTKRSDNLDSDVEAMGQKLKKYIQEKPISDQLFNQLGNYWRLKGNTKVAIECYRRALSICPHSSEVLVNLARVLYLLQYLDDAIFLTKKSLEVHPPDKSAWQQYFTLGEIFKSYGHYTDAKLYLNQTLTFKPGFEPAIAALKDIEDMPEETLHKYTMVIIVCLIFSVLLLVFSYSKRAEQALKHQRHFNKAMAMRSLRGLNLSSRQLKRS